MNPRNLALAAAVVWSLTVFGTTLAAATTGFGRTLMEVYGSIHPGYSVTLAGAFIGLVYAFICAFVAIYVFARLYDELEKKNRK